MKKFKLSWRWFGFGLIALSSLLHLYITLSPANSLMHWYSSDDAFFYFKVAVNVTRGLGVTFDGINRTNGFHPLWMLICIPVFTLARFNLLLPLRVLVMISALLNAGTGILLFNLLNKFISKTTAAAMAVIWVFLPSLQMDVTWGGMESVVSAFCLMLLLYLIVHWWGKTIKFWKLLLLGVVAGLTVLARLDNVFLVLLLGVWFVLGKTSTYTRVIIIGDLAMIFIAGLLTYYIRLRVGFFYQRYSVSLPWLIGLGFCIKPLLFYLFKLYPPSRERLSIKMVGRVVLAVSIASFIIGSALLILKSAGVITALPRSVIIIDWTGTLLGVLILRSFAWLITSRELLQEPEPSRLSWNVFVQNAFGYYAPVGILLGGYMTWSYFYTGVFMPLSGQIKHWWGMLPNTAYGGVVQNIPELFGVWGRFNAWGWAESPAQAVTDVVKGFGGSPQALNIVYLSAIILMLVVILLLVYSQRKWSVSLLDRLGLFAFLLGLYAQIINYTSTSYINTRSWYWIGQMLFTIICFGILLECIRLFMERIRFKPWVWQAAMTIFMAGVILLYGNTVLNYFPYTIAPNQQEQYLAGIHVIEDSTEPGAVIGSTGGGGIGYFIRDRIVVNMDGLINSNDYFQALQKGQGAAFLDRMKMGYVYGNKYVLTETDPYRQMLNGHLGEAITGANNVILYRYLSTP